MLQDEKILITGATGAAARPVACYLARDNEVWGAARFSDPTLREELEQAGVRTAEIDLEKDELDTLPEDVTLVLHYAYTRRPSGEFQEAIKVNAIGAGHVLKRCQQARAALIVSAATLYSWHEDPYHAFVESDDIGHVVAPWGPSSPVSKVTLEAIARFCAEAFDLPTTILRPSAPYGLSIDMVTTVIDSVLEDRPVFAVHDPQPLSVIHVDDMCEQIEQLVDAASIPATVLNWASDEVVTIQEIAALAAERAGRTAQIQIGGKPGVARGAVVDTTRIRSLVGPCKSSFREEFDRVYDARVAASGA
ncbi:MAG: epimerase [Deltaproteobacteria bacterium]|nr:epimerase [Deltaproteobacteria bacterium]